MGRAGGMHGVQNWDPARFFASCQRAARGRGARYARVIFKNNIIFERSARNKNAVFGQKVFTGTDFRSKFVEMSLSHNITVFVFSSR